MTSKTKATTTAPETSPGSLPSAVRGVLAGFDENGEPLVDFLRNPGGRPVPASAAVRLLPDDAGRDAVLVFEDGDPNRPIILGVVRPQGSEPQAKQRSPVEVTADGERVTVTAAEQIVLRCGHASITLTRAGKVLIRGAYLLSRSSGVNRIKGGSVQIN